MNVSRITKIIKGGLVGFLIIGKTSRPKYCQLLTNKKDLPHRYLIIS